MHSYLNILNIHNTHITAKLIGTVIKFRQMSVCLHFSLLFYFDAIESLSALPFSVCIGSVDFILSLFPCSRLSLCIHFVLLHCKMNALKNISTWTVVASTFSETAKDRHSFHCEAIITVFYSLK